MDPVFVTFRIYKNLGGAGAGKEWSNEWQAMFPAGTVITGPEVRAVADALVNFESQIHNQNVYFNRIVASTYFPDENGLAINEDSRGINGTGQRPLPTGSSYYPLEAVVRVNLSGEGGRTGYKEFRGCLQTSDISGDALNFGITSVYARFISDRIKDHLIQNAVLSSTLRLIRTKGNQTQARPVLAASFAGIKFQKTTATRRPKVSLDEDAIIARLFAVLKEMLFVNASIGAAQALGNINDAARVNAAIAQLREATAATPEPS